MSQTAIPLEFERYLQNQISVGNAPDMNEMIFAHIPGLDPSQSINRGNGLPDVSLWVHQQDIDQVGKLGDNALAYSVVIPGTVAEFTFNAIYLRDKNVPSSCGMVVHKAEETKENGMASTKSLVQAYDRAAQIAGITVDASTWQIDYQARLKGIEEDHRLACLDNYGHTAFVDGFDVTQQADSNKYKVTPGVVYVGGLRAVLTGEVIQTIVTKSNGLYVDVVRQGTALSVWENKVTIAVTETELTDYVDGNGEQHYVAKLAGINADGSVVDWRAKGGLGEHELVSQFMPYDFQREYKTGEICTTWLNGQLRVWQMYAGPNLSCKGKDPEDPLNRHEQWPGSPKPWWWIPFTGNTPGQLSGWLSDVIPEEAVLENEVDLNAKMYWRLAERWPELVSGEGNAAIINTRDVLGRYVRTADGSNYLLNQTHGDAIRNITAQINSQYSWNDGFGNAQASGAFQILSLTNTDSSITGNDTGPDHDYNLRFDASRVVPTANQNQPVTTIENKIVFI